MITENISTRKPKVKNTYYWGHYTYIIYIHQNVSSRVQPLCLPLLLPSMNSGIREAKTGLFSFKYCPEAKGVGVICRRRVLIGRDFWKEYEYYI